MANHEFNGAFENATIYYGNGKGIAINLNTYKGNCTSWIKAIKNAGYPIHKITGVDLIKLLGCFIDDPEAVYRNIR